MPTPERCLLGRNITAHRRKRDAACFNSKGWERPQGLNESCDCTAVRAAALLLMWCGGLMGRSEA